LREADASGREIAQIDPRDVQFARRESPRVSGVAAVIPPPFRRRGWFWWTSQLIAHAMRPSPRLSRHVEAALDASGLRAALAASPVIGVHVRHGDACRPEEELL